jgi:hypothetical protein
LKTALAGISVHAISQNLQLTNKDKFFIPSKTTPLQEFSHPFLFVFKNKSLIVFFFCLISSHSIFSQIKYEKGYFIDNNDQRTECLIRNVDWDNDPSEFDYKLNSGENSKTVKIADAKEFGVYNFSTYVRAKVKRDISMVKGDKFSRSRAPEWKEEVLFLKVLIRGDATLLTCKKSNTEYFFFTVGNAPVEQLIYKQYIIPKTESVGFNRDFVAQLNTHVKCGDYASSNLANLSYKSGDLKKYFHKYNACKGSPSIDTETKIKRDLFNLFIRPGINVSSLSILYNDRFNIFKVNFDKRVSFRFGLETEFIFPYRKNKWAITLEPTYRSFKAEATNQSQKSTVDYKSIELPAGLKHNFFVNNDSKIFLTAAYVFDFSLRSNLNVNPYSLDVKSYSNYSAGVGYCHKKYSVEMRFFSIRNVLKYNPYWQNDFKNYSLILGYKLF